MKLKLQRFSDQNLCTLGLLFVNGEFFCYVLEDRHQPIKVMHETRIPAGTYFLTWQEAVTPMTKRYRERYAFFDKHIMLNGVENYTGIYIHVGNNKDHTSGCLLVGDGVNNNSIGDGALTASVQAFKRLYKKLQPFLNDEEPVEIEIINEDELQREF